MCTELLNMGWLADTSQINSCSLRKLFECTVVWFFSVKVADFAATFLMNAVCSKY